MMPRQQNMLFAALLAAMLVLAFAVGACSPDRTVPGPPRMETARPAR